MQGNPEKIIELARKQGVIRPRDLENEGLPRVALTRLVRQGKLKRVARGLYALPDRQETESSILVEVARKYPQGIICLLSALHAHGLTTHAPHEVWLAIPNKSRSPRMDYPPLRIVRFSGQALSEGVEEHLVEGVKVRITGVAKTIADCFKYRNKIGLDIAQSALRDAWGEKRVSMEELMQYADVCRVANVMRPYLASLT